MQPHEVAVPTVALDRLEPLIGSARADVLREAARLTSKLMAGRTVWNLNSTATGGGVAEMLQVLVGYIRGAGVDTRWLVIEGDPDFFAITKRIHNRIHGVAGDAGDLGDAEAGHYREVLDRNLPVLAERVRDGDVVLLHDPQTAGLIRAVRDLGAHPVWRCHIGLDHANRWTDEAWGFLRPFLAGAEATVFSREAYVPSWLPADRALVVPPSIDPFSPKNQAMDAAAVDAVLETIGFGVGGARGARPVFVRRDGTTGTVTGTAEVIGERVPASAPLVVQVSRWDALKDMRGVLDGFVERVGPRDDIGAHLALVGPATAGVSDDPEGATVFADCIAAWRSLEPDVQQRVHLVGLPMDDGEANAAMVNAIQRRATVVVQKSLAEGFGLTVAEAMWKARPVVASAVGGITDQVTAGTGVLLPDPADLRAFGDAVVDLLERPEHAAALGTAAHRRVLEDFVGDRHLLRYAALLARLIG